MAISIFTDIKYRTQQSSKLSAADVDSNFATTQAQSLASSNSIIYLGPSPSSYGWTVSNGWTNSNYPGNGRFTATIIPNGYNIIGSNNFNLVNGTTFSFVFSATSSGLSQSSTYGWWDNLRNGHRNMVFSLSSVQNTSQVWEYSISTMSYDASLMNWKFTGSKISGPTSGDLSRNNAYAVGYRTIQPPNTSLNYSWTASIPMSGRNFPITIGTMSPNVISNSNYLVKLSSASVQFVGMTTSSLSQIHPSFGINILGGDEVLATATFSGGTYSQNQIFRLRPTNLMVDGDTQISLTGITFSAWSGITFSNASSSRIAVFVTYQLIANDTGFDPID